MTRADAKPTTGQSMPTSSRWHRVEARFQGWQAGHRRVNHAVRTIQRYHHDQVEYYALKVVSRGLFLAVSVMLVFLYVFDLTTSLIPGINEITIPTMSLPDEQDLGAVVHVTFEQTRGDLLGIAGALTLLISAVFTAKALRTGTNRVLAPPTKGRVRTLQFRNLVIGLGMAVLLLISWLLAFATAIRSAAIRAMLGNDVSDLAIHTGKILVIVLAWMLLTTTLFLAVRPASENRPTGFVLLPMAAFAAVIVGANFVLLYSYIAALYDSDSSGGVVLVLTLLAWVNTLARGFFLTECWIVEAGHASAGSHRSEPEQRGNPSPGEPHPAGSPAPARRVDH